MSRLVKGDIAFVGSTKVRLLTDPRRIPGGYCADVERVEDSADPAMQLSDGSVHPAHRAGFRWSEPEVNLRREPR